MYRKSLGLLMFGFVLQFLPGCRKNVVIVTVPAVTPPELEANATAVNGTELEWEAGESGDFYIYFLYGSSPCRHGRNNLHGAPGHPAHCVVADVTQGDGPITYVYGVSPLKVTVPELNNAQQSSTNVATTKHDPIVISVPPPTPCRLCIVAGGSYDPSDKKKVQVKASKRADLLPTQVLLTCSADGTTVKPVGEPPSSGDLSTVTVSTVTSTLVVWDQSPSARKWTITFKGSLCMDSDFDPNYIVPTLDANNKVCRFNPAALSGPSHKYEYYVTIPASPGNPACGGAAQPFYIQVNNP